MKKIVLLLGVSIAIASSSAVFAQDFASLTDLTPEQKQQLSQIQANFKQQNDSLENRIMEYNNKLERIKNDTERTQAQIGLLTGAYERNLETLKVQQKILKQEADNAYKTVMTPDQFKQYQAQQIQVDAAFQQFLQK